jgi:GMP reductase
MHREYNYEDVYMVPRKCVVKSRSECDISVEFGKMKFNNPVIAANMKSVVNYDTCNYLASKNMFYIMHRFNIDQKELSEFIKESNRKYGFSSISIGIQDTDIQLLKFLSENNAYPTYITIDIAHAYSDKCLKMCHIIKSIFPDVFLIVGNIATSSAVLDFQSSNLVNAFKIFIAPGTACTTKIKTGFTRGTISCIQECYRVSQIPLIADGGIKNPGHIAMAIACGARMVMSGSFMSGYDQNSGQIVEINGHKKYIYYGSASFNNKQNNK